MSISNKDNKNTYVRLDTGGENFSFSPVISKDFVSTSLKNKITLELQGISQVYSDTIVEIFTDANGQYNLINTGSTTAQYSGGDQSYYYQDSSHNKIETINIWDSPLKPKAIVVSEISSNPVSFQQKSRVEVSLNGGLNYAFTQPSEYKTTDDLLETSNLPIALSGNSQIKLKMYIDSNITMPIGLNTLSGVLGGQTNVDTERNYFTSAINKNNLKTYIHGYGDASNLGSFREYNYISNTYTLKPSFNTAPSSSVNYRALTAAAGDEQGFNALTDYFPENRVYLPTPPPLSSTNSPHGYFNYNTGVWISKASIPICRRLHSGGKSGTTTSFNVTHGFGYDASFIAPEQFLAPNFYSYVFNNFRYLFQDISGTHHYNPTFDYVKDSWLYHSRYTNNSGDVANYSYTDPNPPNSIINVTINSPFNIFEYSCYKFNGTTWSSIADHTAGIAAWAEKTATNSDNTYMSLAGDDQGASSTRYTANLGVRFQYFNGTTWSIKNYGIDLSDQGSINNYSQNALTFYGGDVYACTLWDKFYASGIGFLHLNNYNTTSNSWSLIFSMQGGDSNDVAINSPLGASLSYINRARTTQITSTPGNLWIMNFGLSSPYPYPEAHFIYKYSLGNPSGIRGVGIKLIF